MSLARIILSTLPVRSSIRRMRSTPPSAFISMQDDEISSENADASGLALLLAFIGSSFCCLISTKPPAARSPDKFSLLFISWRNK